ncbi:MAG: DeoR/GlpR family DNA-binding transcription regulator [Spirochaetaceae bacterium]
MRNNVISQNRQNLIIKKLHAEGEVNVNDLSVEFNVTPITIRRDLNTLGDKGLLYRIHGGAILTEMLRSESLFSEKGHQHISEKAKIGKIAASLINDEDTVFLNSGSTTLEVIKHLTGKHVKVITNNVAVLNIPRDPLIEIFLVGGEFREASQSLVGDMAKDTLSNVYSSCTILGANGINKSFGLTSSVQQETSINRLMVERCHGPVIVLADSSKIGVVSSFSTASLNQITTLITDKNADETEISSFKDLGINVIIA